MYCTVPFSTYVTHFRNMYNQNFNSSSNMPLPGDEALTTLTIITISDLKQIIYLIVNTTYLVFKNYIIKLKYNVGMRLCNMSLPGIGKPYNNFNK